MRKGLLVVVVTCLVSVVLDGAAAGHGNRAGSVFFFRHGALVRVSLPLSGTGSPGRSALVALLDGPPVGYSTAIPPGTRLVSVRTSGGIGSATFSAALGTPTRSAQGQIVATVARALDVTRVTISRQGYGHVALEAGDEHARPAGARVSDYVDLTAAAPIFVASPARDSTVSSPVRLAGTADTFEASFQLEVHSGGRLLSTRTIQASSGTGTRGTWAKSLALPSGPARLVFYEASAKDGSRIHVTVVHLHVR